MNDIIEIKRKHKKHDYNPPLVGVLSKYNEHLLNPDCEYICVVEGSTDEHFYKNFSLFYLQKERCEYIYYSADKNRSGEKNKISGKEAVIKTYFDIKHDNKFSKGLSKTIFIVDKDYQDTLESQKRFVSTSDKRCFSITPYHSMESFFLIPENVDILFQIMSIEKKYKDEFYTLLFRFQSEVAKYYAYIGAVVDSYAYKCERIKYRKKSDAKEIFNSLIKNNALNYNKALLHEELDILSKVPMNPLARKNLEKKKRKLNSNYLYIQGHVMFSLLVEYLQKTCKKQIGISEKDTDSKRYYKFIKYLDSIHNCNLEYMGNIGEQSEEGKNYKEQLEVDMELILGNGEECPV
jgi:hypothetical protein